MRVIVVYVLVAAVGCGSPDPADVGTVDAAAPADAALPDAPGSDAGAFDAGVSDAPVSDAALGSDVGAADAPVAPDAPASSTDLTVMYTDASGTTSRRIETAVFCDRAPMGGSTQLRFQVGDGYSVLLVMAPASVRAGDALSLARGFTVPYASWSDPSPLAPAPFRRAFLPPTASGSGTAEVTTLSASEVALEIDETWSDAGLDVHVTGRVACPL